MYITDLTHFLDRTGTIGPLKGPARAMAQFHVDVVAHASGASASALPAPKCFKCKKGVVDAVRAHDDAIVWTCPMCGATEPLTAGRSDHKSCAACRPRRLALEARRRSYEKLLARPDLAPERRQRAQAQLAEVESALTGA